TGGFPRAIGQRGNTLLAVIGDGLLHTIRHDHFCYLLIKVKQFMAVASPFPGNQPGEARV
ncbi:hypothetical protein, partial [Yersinia pseudotuberculosis]|uniref:hypothetical protein n=1 Tax=Yersinia pseudotuberculosis TaxID=633 RepID=UPI0018C20C09